MTRALADAPPSYYRLSEDSWAQIREAYRQGATARELAVRWKVSPSSIYRHACEGGWTKTADGDAVAREHAAAIAAEQAADETAPALSAPLEDSEDGDMISDSFVRVLTAMDRAVAAGRASEALTLGKLLQVLEQLNRILEDDTPSQGAARGARGDALDGPAPGYVVKTTAQIAEEKAQKAIEIKDRATTIWPYIEKVARGMLGDEQTGPALYSRVVMRWRAQTFGPEVARADWRRCVESGHAGRIYDDDGNILDGFWV